MHRDLFMITTRNSLIPGSPLREKAYFTGPAAWWLGDSLPYDREQHLLTVAGRLQQHGFSLQLLLQNSRSGDGDDPHFEKIRAVFSKIEFFSANPVDVSLFTSAHRMLTSLLHNCPSKIIDSIALFSLWLIQVKPRLLHLWDADEMHMLLAAVVAGVPKIIVTGQNLSPLCRSACGFGGVEESFAFAILSNLLRLPGVIMTNTSHVGCRDYERWLGLLRGSVIYTPYPIDAVDVRQPDESRIAALRHALEIAEGGMLLCGVSHFSAIEDPELWLCTALRVCAEHPDLYAVCAGEGPELIRLEKRIAESPFASRILFPGNIEDEPAFFGMCDVFLHTSNGDGLPLGVLKAQAYGAPVVATRCGGVDDIVISGESGFIVDSRDERVLAGHLNQLLQHPRIMEQMGDNARAHTLSNFSSEVALSPIIQLYDTLLFDEIKNTPSSVDSVPLHSELEVVPTEVPLVSIVLPTYNHLEYLPAAVDSVLRQTYPNFELIIVNDGSTDGTAEYLKTISSPHVKIIEGPNTRLPTALNRGFAQASGEYWTWTSADNICLPHFCETLVQALEATPQAGFASAPFARIDNNGIIIDHLRGETIPDRMFFSNGAGAAFMYRRQFALQAGGFSPELEGAEDWDMWLRILDLTRPVYVPSLLYLYRWHEASMTFRIADKVRQSSLRAAFRALRRLEKRGGVKALYPQIAQCANKELALFHANLVFGSRMIDPASFLKGSAVNYLAIAHAMRPDDLIALGNYAVSLAYHGKYDEALKLLKQGESLNKEVFLCLRDHCLRQRHNAGSFSFCCPTLGCPDQQESELIRRVHADRIVFSVH